MITASPMADKHNTGSKRWMINRSKNRTDIEHPNAVEKSLDNDKISKLKTPKISVTSMKKGGKLTPDKTVGIEAII